MVSLAPILTAKASSGAVQKLSPSSGKYKPSRLRLFTGKQGYFVLDGNAKCTKAKPITSPKKSVIFLDSKLFS